MYETYSLPASKCKLIGVLCTSITVSHGKVMGGQYYLVVMSNKSLIIHCLEIQDLSQGYLLQGNKFYLCPILNITHTGKIMCWQITKLYSKHF